MAFFSKKANQEDFQKVIHKALLLFNNYGDFSKVRKNAMKSCFSWTSAAKKYAQIYSWALEKIPITETILFECGQLFGFVKDFMLPSINRAQ